MFETPSLHLRFLSESSLIISLPPSSRQNELGLLLGEMTSVAAEEWFMMIDTDEDGYIGFREMEDYCVGKLAFTREQVMFDMPCFSPFDIPCF